MITMKRFLIIFLVSVCGSLALLAQSTTGVRTTMSDNGLQQIGAANVTMSTTIHGSMMQSGRTDATSLYGGKSSNSISTNQYRGLSNSSLDMSMYGGLAVPMGGAVVDETGDNTVRNAAMRKPGAGTNTGGLLPIGDAVLPLLLMAAAYACFRLRRRTAEAAE